MYIKYIAKNIEMIVKMFSRHSVECSSAYFIIVQLIPLNLLFSSFYVYCILLTNRFLVLIG